MKYSPTTDNGRPRAAVACAVLSLVALIAAYAGGARAEDKPKVDWWCGVIAKQIDHNREEGRKPHDSAGSEQLREERRRLDKDAHDRHCNGN